MKDQLSGKVDLSQLFDSSAAPHLLESLTLRGDSTSTARGILCAVMGRPHFLDDDIEELSKTAGIAAALAEAWSNHGSAMPSRLRSSYAVVIVDTERKCVFVAVDRFAIQTLCYRIDAASFTFSNRADCVEGRGGELDPQAIYDYLYFHMIPAPRTIFRQVKRLPAAHSLLIDRDGTHESRHWPLRFDEEHKPPFPLARDNLRHLIRDAVAEECDGQERVGAFLSGGTDSSTVAGMLCQVAGKSAPTYSIGFEAEGYDEMEYARLSAKHFGCDHHEYYVTPADLLESIPVVAKHHDQPFGNSSALPAYYCAKMAKADGCTKLLAGDGGDELFGGNTRYAMQKFLEYYHSVPKGLRQFVEPLSSSQSSLRKIPGLRQILGYVRHSRVPMPYRLQNMNLLMEMDPRKVFSEDFMVQVNGDEPTKHMQGIWSECSASSLINRMLAFDWRYTLADSDLPKVRGATDMAGIAVAYPLLDDRITDFSMELPHSWKLKGFKLRWFFKEALRGFLPDEVITKKKQGFGLPYGPWMVRDPQLSRLAKQSLQGLVDRGIVQQAFVTDLMDQRLKEHPGYFGNMVWVLMMLELWLQGQDDVYLPH
jgi:asparagine synthase (glutamine-hydrolysing)